MVIRGLDSGIAECAKQRFDPRGRHLLRTEIIDLIEADEACPSTDFDGFSDDRLEFHFDPPDEASTVRDGID